ncbi:MAG: hypothetical protein AB7U20_15215 [Planctomycetaceae bacterium]
MSRCACLFVVMAALLAVPSTLAAAPPALNVQVGGLELLPQSLFGAALFLFEVRGEVDGAQRRGWGWVAVNHEPLPEAEMDSSFIVGGEGAIYIGLRAYDIEINGGLLTLTDLKDPAIFDDAFEVLMDATISRRGQSAAHLFAGELDHEPFPPTIIGQLGVAP